MIPAWHLFREGYLDGKHVILTKEQVLTIKPVSKNSKGIDCYRVYRVECQCGFTGRTRRFGEACEEMMLHNTETAHVMISLRAGVFPLSRLGEKN